MRCKLCLHQKNPKVARELSEILGTNTIKSHSRSRQLTGKGGRSENSSDHSRALMLPQEIMRLGCEKSILLLENCEPIKCNKIRWYQDDAFKQRGNSTAQCPVVPIVSVKINKAPVTPIVQIKTTDESPQKVQQNHRQQPDTQPENTITQDEIQSNPQVDEGAIDSMVDDYFQLYDEEAK